MLMPSLLEAHSENQQRGSNQQSTTIAFQPPLEICQEVASRC